MILQRYTFGSKSQPSLSIQRMQESCLWYCKDIHLEANHNGIANMGNSFALLMILQRYTFGSKSQQERCSKPFHLRCLWYCKDIHLEANHNRILCKKYKSMLLMILQRYTFGSKSQRNMGLPKVLQGCLWYCKDIHLEANHNTGIYIYMNKIVAYDIAKIYIWKQITTQNNKQLSKGGLLMILQRYTFGSKSQHRYLYIYEQTSCLWYCKDIHLEANHNTSLDMENTLMLLMILQRYTFGSKSQQRRLHVYLNVSCLWYCKDIHLEANHNRVCCK